MINPVMASAPVKFASVAVYQTKALGNGERYNAFQEETAPFRKVSNVPDIYAPDGNRITVLMTPDKSQDGDLLQLSRKFDLPIAITDSFSGGFSTYPKR